jgi:micrococcal nuclease|tara:strand:- start:601 stop:1017 length:417 start_codon:yes stop_codon:yes gene_type:complete
MYEYYCEVTRIVDGDTLDVDIDLGFSTKLTKQRIRMLGIDTPESRTRDLEEKSRGLLSKKFLINLCPLGSKIRLRSHGKGKFGRILGEIFTPEGEVSINKQMCDEGYAVEYYGGNKDELSAKHQANKEKLIAKGIITV